MATESPHGEPVGRLPLILGKSMNGNSPENFTVRIRFRVPSHTCFDVDAPQFLLWSDARPTAILGSVDQTKPIREAEWLVLRSDGWGSVSAAEDAVEPLMDALRRSLAVLYMGVDLGGRSAQSAYYRAGLEMVEEATGNRVLNDTHGPMVFATHPRPMFARAGVINQHRPIPIDSWRRAFSLAFESGASLSIRERTAFDLYSAAQAVAESGDARFVLTFAAFEALLEVDSHPDAVIDHLDRLIELTLEADIDQTEKTPLLDSLRNLRRKSIRGSGRRFVRERLSGRVYRGQSAEEMFLTCYDLRNRLIHGAEPFPTRREVQRLLEPMDRIVGDLLAGTLLNCQNSL